MMYLVFNTRVFTLRVFSDGDQIDVFVRRLMSRDRFTRPDICIKVEFSTKRFMIIKIKMLIYDNKNTLTGYKFFLFWFVTLLQIISRWHNLFYLNIHTDQ